MSNKSRQPAGQGLRTYEPGLYRTAAALVFVFGTAFLIVDRLWMNVLFQSVRQAGGTLGELYGPLSFFRLLFLWISVFLTFLCALGNFRMR